MTTKFRRILQTQINRPGDKVPIKFPFVSMSRANKIQIQSSYQEIGSTKVVNMTEMRNNCSVSSAASCKLLERIAVQIRIFLIALHLLFATALATAAEPQPTPQPLPQAHAHNDYEHKRPLLDALDHGFCSVEADIWLRDGKLLVAHDARDLKPERTLKALYLDPLRTRVAANDGRVYKNGPRFWLLIDIKTTAEPTYRALHDTLANYADIISTTRDGKHDERTVTVVISGNRPIDYVTKQTTHHAGIDGRLTDLGSDSPAHLMPMISDRWGAHFKWSGDGPMPDEERKKLREIVVKAHARGRVVRFWATPESPAVWKELRDAKVDLINTDELEQLQKFLSAADSPKPTTVVMVTPPTAQPIST